MHPEDFWVASVGVLLTPSCMPTSIWSFLPCASVRLEHIAFAASFVWLGRDQSQ